MSWWNADVLSGVAVTIVLAVLTSVAALVVGLAAAIGRRSRRRFVPQIAGSFVEIFRNVPALILMIFFAFAVPNVFSADLRRTLFFDNPIIDLLSTITRLPIPYYGLAAAVALTCNTGAHLAEVLRSGMNAVPTDRIDVARTLGASARSAYFTITIPDGVRIAFPGITNRLVHNLKNTALASFVAVPDAFNRIQGLITRTFDATNLLIAAAVIYLALATVLEFGMHRVERALWRGRPIDRSIDV